MYPISFDSLIARIESDSFYAEIALINDLESLLLFLKFDSYVKNLIDIIGLDIDNYNLIKNRIEELWQFECDPNKLHPYDHSIAVYLYVIYKSSESNIEPILHFIYRNKLKNLYWTYEMFNYIYKNLLSVSTQFCDNFQMSEFKNMDFIDISALDSD